MKTIDIINLWSAFNRVYEDSTLTNEEKRVIGEEVLSQFPHAHILHSVQGTLTAVTRSIRDRIDELEKPSGSSEPQDGPKERQGKPKAKPLRKTEPNT